MGIMLKNLYLDDPQGVGAHLDIERLLHGLDTEGLVKRAIARPVQPPGLLMAGGSAFKGLPFGGRMRREQTRRRGEGILLAQDSSVPTGNGGGGARRCSDLYQMARECRPWGAPPPANCVDRNGFIKPHMVCGVVLPYREAAIAAAATPTYTFKARRWAQPIKWIDASGADIVITSAKYQDTSIWGTVEVEVVPLDVFGAGDNERVVPGMPALGNNDGEATVYKLRNDHATDAEDFAGIQIGFAAMP